MADPRYTLLHGIVGSTAYGLATPDSDIDRLEVFAHPTQAVLGLNPPRQTYVTTHPDLTAHEAWKFLTLALKCNPTVTELLWLPDDCYEYRYELGSELIAIREKLLSRKYVRDAYMGYATQQFQKLKDRHGEGFGTVPKNRTEKHARHLARLCQQGFELYATGTMSVRLADPEWFHDFGRKAAQNVEYAEGYLAEMGDRFDACTSVLPEQPDVQAAEAWLRQVRTVCWQSGAEL